MTEALQHQDLLDTDAMMRLSQVEMVATRFVEGFLAGKHRSPFKGGCIEFSEHRAYSPGDEIRLIDWRAYGRSDRHYIKLFEQETNLQAIIVLDASGSMGFGMKTVSKFHYARVAAACLGRLMLRQRDAVGLAVIDTHLRTYIPPRSSPGHFRAILDGLAGSSATGDTSLAAILYDLARRIKRRGLVILLSDCFDDVDPFLRALYHLRARGHEALLFHVMAPEELSFSFTRHTRFECLERMGVRMDLDPAGIRKRYLASLGTFLERLRSGCREVKCDYAPLVTDQPVGEALSRHLALRMARVK